MNKWETLQIHTEKEAHRLGREIDRAVLNNEWATTRDLAVQIVTISSFLHSMNSIETIKEQQKNEAEIEKMLLRAKRDRKRDKRARKMLDSMEESAV